MSGWCEHQSSIGDEDHRRAAPQQYRREPNEPKAVNSQALPDQAWQHNHAGDAESNSGDVPRREARPEAEARNHNPSRPNADSNKAEERPARVFLTSWARHLQHFDEMTTEFRDAIVRSRGLARIRL